MIGVSRRFRHVSSEGGSLPVRLRPHFENERFEPITQNGPDGQQGFQKGQRQQQVQQEVGGSQQDMIRTQDYPEDFPNPLGSKPQGLMETLCHSMCGMRPALSVVIAMDSFKGSLTSKEAADVVEAALRDSRVDRIYKQPISDGGEGFLEAFKAICSDSFQILRVSDITGPLGEKLSSLPILIDIDEGLAVLESASASGYLLVPEDKQAPMRASSFGTGEMIMHAVEAGARVIYIGVGDTITVDGGAGLAQALGVEFFDSDGIRLDASQGNIVPRVHSVDMTSLDSRLDRVTFIAAADVQNALLGTEGAVSVFGPQKGLKNHSAILDHDMQHYASVIETACQKPGLSMMPGSGAGGGIAYSLMAFCRADLQSGFKVIVDKADLTERIKKADLVITGEGNLDASTLYGKLPIQVGRLCKEYGTKCFLICGRSDQDVMELPEEGISIVMPLVDSRASPEAIVEAQANVKLLLHKQVTRSLKLLRLGQQVKI